MNPNKKSNKFFVPLPLNVTSPAALVEVPVANLYYLGPDGLWYDVPVDGATRINHDFEGLDPAQSYTVVIGGNPTRTPLTGQSNAEINAPVATTVQLFV